MSNENFYSKLESFRDFGGITDDTCFGSIPPDWKVIITDLKGSTQAIEAGRYKDVNTIGSACIAAVQNSMGDMEFPYAFGGDGASMVVPPGSVEGAVRELRRLQVLSTEKFGLELRVGMIGVDALLREGRRLEVARYELAHGKCVAIFRGGGLMLADEKIKSDGGVYDITGDAAGEADLTGLSCRWSELPHKNGKILSLLVLSRSPTPATTYQGILSEMRTIFGGELHRISPVNLPAARYKTMAQCFREERRLHGSMFSPTFARRCLEIVAAVLIFRHRVPAMVFDPSKYSESMRVQSDYRKFDDMLKMVIDCSHEQAEKLRSHLEGLLEQGQIYYGLHESEAALMTCYVQSTDDGKHIHFIDGGNGGYAMAAKQMKLQMKDKSAPA